MAKDKIAKTNAARLLDRDKVKYELVPYEVDENDLSCVHVAATLGENIEQVFKTLVLQGDKSGYFVCVIPGEHEIDLKLAAKISGNKKCDLIPMKELLPLTGYIRGGCSPIGMKKHFPTRRSIQTRWRSSSFQRWRRSCQWSPAGLSSSLSHSIPARWKWPHWTGWMSRHRPL